MIRATHISFFCDSRSCILWSLSITLFYSIIFPCLILIDPLSNFLLLNSIIFLSLSLTLFDSLAIYLVLYSILFLFLPYTYLSYSILLFFFLLLYTFIFQSIFTLFDSLSLLTPFLLSLTLFYYLSFFSFDSLSFLVFRSFHRLFCSNLTELFRLPIPWCLCWKKALQSDVVSHVISIDHSEWIILS